MQQQENDLAQLKERLVVVQAQRDTLADINRTLTQQVVAREGCTPHLAQV